jgi:hypothetical protein
MMVFDEHAPFYTFHAVECQRIVYRLEQVY